MMNIELQINVNSDTIEVKGGKYEKEQIEKMGMCYFVICTCSCCIGGIDSSKHAKSNYPGNFGKCQRKNSHRNHSPFFLYGDVDNEFLLVTSFLREEQR